MEDKDVTAFRARYTLSGQIIADGGYGIVHHGVRRTDGEKVAIKRILRSNYDPKDLPRLAVEIALCKRLSHKHIVKCYDVYNFVKENEVRMIFELARGEELFTLIASQGRLPEVVTRTLIHQLLLALQYIHGQGIVFRDIKPENLLLKEPFVRGNYHLLLCDFGLAVVKGEEPCYGAIGSIYYIAPEALQPKEYSEKVDVWSTGIVTHACVAGFPPFCTNNANTEEIINLIQNTELDLTVKEVSHLTDDLKHFLRRTICKDPGSRMSSTDALAHPWISRPLKTAAAASKAPVHNTNPNIKFTNYSTYSSADTSKRKK